MPGGRTLLKDEEVAQFLAAHPGWSRQGDALVREYTFATFPEAIAFVTRVAEVAERHQHHPDIDIRYRKVRLLLTTHDAGGLTARDSLVAEACDQVG
ncbi:MAG: 4a-hydroxytetrahydrobiopterin dehydratase [Myxococcaceae bacterium]|nr:4a-hydroxytetrahydrobiopterin dehydratase [Myxococcaceae bacterium]